MMNNNKRVCNSNSLPARASEQGNVIGLVSVYFMSSKKFVIE